VPDAVERPTPPRANERPTPSRAVVLLSGGLDSATTLAIAKAEGFVCYALTVRYGQRNDAELDAARCVAETIGVAGRKEIAVDLAAIGGSALTDDIPVPAAADRCDDRAADGAADQAVNRSVNRSINRSGDRTDDRSPSGDGIPVTYVPARNTIFLSLALAWAEVLEANHIFIGVNAVDYSGYPDCRPEFIAAFEGLAALATKAGAGGSLTRVHTPLMALSKAEIIRRGTALGVDYGITLSCYDPSPDGSPCDRCEACGLRRQGFAEAGIGDPAAR